MQQSATCVPTKFKECPAQGMKDARGEISSILADH